MRGNFGDETRLRHILDAISEIQSYTKDTDIEEYQRCPRRTEDPRDYRIQPNQRSNQLGIMPGAHFLLLLDPIPTGSINSPDEKRLYTLLPDIAVGIIRDDRDTGSKGTREYRTGE